MNLRKEARGRDCTVRLPCCNGNPETVVFAHLRMSGVTGFGWKPDSRKGQYEPGCFACSDCHDAIDRRRYLDYDYDFVRLNHLEAVIRTQKILHDEGKPVA